MSATCHSPIGIFDSGLGGLSVFRVLPALLPAERFVYVADSGRAPYGPRSKEEIVAFSRQIVEHLVELEKCKAIVIACNTATAAAAKVLRKRYPTIPIIGMEPAEYVIFAVINITLRARSFNAHNSRPKDRSQ